MMAAQIHKVKNNIIEILSTEMQMAAIDKKSAAWNEPNREKACTLLWNAVE